MKKESISNILKLLTEIFYLAIIFLTPLYFAFFLTGNSVFVLNKMILFKSLTILLGLMFVFKIMIHPVGIGNIKIELAKRKYLLFPIFFLFSLTIVTLASFCWELSFWGLYSRQEGLVSFIYYLVFFFLLLANINTFSQLKRLFISVGLSSFLVSLYAILQIMGIDAFSWKEPAWLTGRAASTLGQPNYLGSFLLLAIPFPLYLLYKHRQDRLRYLWGVVVAVNIAALYFTKSEAAWLGAGVFLLSVFMAHIWFRIADTGRKKLVLVSVAVAAVIVSSFLAWRVLDDSRFIKTGSVAARVNIWQGAVQAIAEHPFLGWGLDNQRNALASYYEKDWAVYGNINVIPSRAHNIFLDILLAGGMFYLVFYLALLYLFFKLLYSNLSLSYYRKQDNMQAVNLLLLGGFVGYLTSLLFGFAVVTTHIYFWFYLAVLITINNRLQNVKPVEKEEQALSTLPSGVKIFLMILIVLGAGVFLRKQFAYLAADHYFQNIKTAHAGDRYLQMLKLDGYIKDLAIRDDYYQGETSLMLAKRVEDMKGSPLAKLGEEVLKDALEEMSGSRVYEDVYIKAQVYTALASSEESYYFDQAEQVYKKLLSMAPEVPGNYRAYANMLAKKGEYKKALANYQKALDNTPSTDNPYMNGDHTKKVKREKYSSYKNMGDIHFFQENYKKARDYYRLAYNNNLSDISLYKKIADAYYKQGDLDKAVEENKRGYVRDPSDHVWPFAIALLYKEKGDNDKALEYGEQALDLAPDSKQIKEFIKELN
jgi:putative inorganic carbon (HCO3(-)) transporter